MIKRPLSPQFADLVTSGRKTTTIRKTAWPMDVPIMLYRWAGKAYRSKQVNVAIVEVVHLHLIRITHCADGVMVFASGLQLAKPLWWTEGFESPEALDAWFRERIARGASVQMTLMCFSVLDARLEISRELGGLAWHLGQAARHLKHYEGLDDGLARRVAELRCAAKRVRANGERIKKGKGILL